LGLALTDNKRLAVGCQAYVYFLSRNSVSTVQYCAR